MGRSWSSGHAFSRTAARIFSAALLLAGAPTAHASEGDAGDPVTPRDKRMDWFLAPTPRAHMRELSTDRPDKTESPYTVDAGHFQGEIDLVNWARDKTRSERTDSFAFGTANLKLGLTDHSDLQVVVETWNVARTEDRATGESETQRGFGDITVRWKANIFGNDGGPVAVAIMPYVKLPTNQDALGNDEVEGGLIVPVAVELPWEMGLGLMSQLDIVRDEEGKGYHGEFVNSITVSRGLVGDLSGYLELWTLVSAESSRDWQATLDMGLTYGLTEDIQLDAGVNVGLTESADDVNPFVGITIRY